MSHNSNHLYKFRDFSFDAEKRVLLLDQKPVQMTPKTLKLLQVLIENHGQIVEKEKLMSEIWADSFVEDSNLTFTVRQLRKALGDDAREPTYIETIPRRGYRFIAELRENIDGNGSPNSAEQTFSEPIERKPTGSKRIIKFFVPAVGVLIVAVIVTGFWYAESKNLKATAPIFSVPFSSEKLSTNGKVSHAVISRDGKNVVYTNGSKGKQSVWLRELKSANNVEIIPASDDFYGGLALSPDGDFLYFARLPKSVEGQFDIYRVSIFGGISQKIVNEAQGWISISPDGTKISFVRCHYRNEENCSLWIADSLDGKNERKLVSRPRPVRIADNEISPDGKTVAFAVGQSGNQANEFGLVEVNIESGAERELTREKFFNIKHLQWLPDGSGWLLTARKNTERNFRIWQVSATGEASPLTKDSESYVALSLDKDASALVSTQVKPEFRARLFQTQNPSGDKILADATGVAFAPNGNIIIASSMAGNSDIWSINRDGSGQRQLTNDAADEILPVVSYGNNSIFFYSLRTGEGHVWRMNADGSNQTQITKKEGGFPLFASPDGKWLYYLSGQQRTLWRVLTNGGEEQLVFNKRNHHFTLSPDGSWIAFSEKQGEENILTIVSLADWQTVKTFKLADGKARLVELEWSRDGKFLAYILVEGESKNNILWFQPLDAETPRQIADLGDEGLFEISGLALAPDGKSFAVVQGSWRHDAVLLKGLK